MLSDSKCVAEWFHFDTKTRTLCILPLYHNNGQVPTLLAPLYQGGSTVIVQGKVSLLSFWDLVNKYDVTCTSVMASILSMLLSIPNERKDQTLKGIICGGQVLTRTIQKQFEERFKIPIFEGYGLTETTSFSCLNCFPAEKRKIGSIGKVLPANEMTILDENSKDVGENNVGEICIRGYNVTIGYLGLKEKNEKSFRDGWFHSGDFGWKDSDGFFYFQGREDFLIIKGGMNIYPAELENVLYQHPDIIECAVIGIPHKLLGEDICAFVKCKEESEVSQIELKEFCKNNIGGFKQPQKIVIINLLGDLDDIPKGPTKKILYRELKKYYMENLSDNSILIDSPI
jgi:acyl-CoA synthetase (AMP-forming)/AMP-acid ligase II